MVNPGVNGCANYTRTKSTENTPKNAKRRQPTEDQKKIKTEI